MGLAGASALRGMKVRTQGVTWAGGHKWKEMEDTAQAEMHQQPQCWACEV